MNREFKLGISPCRYLYSLNIVSTSELVVFVEWKTLFSVFAASNGCLHLPLKYIALASITAVNSSTSSTQERKKNFTNFLRILKRKSFNYFQLPEETIFLIFPLVFLEIQEFINSAEPTLSLKSTFSTVKL